jgi:tripartite-type tricarboxylate transporter receptor subunit TctC
VPTQRAWGLTIAALIAGGLVAQPAQAQSVADFYKGKTISMIVGGSPGGGFDTLARAIARYIGDHIPGKPGVVVRNMPGAGGTMALDHLYNAADKDGTVIALVNNTPPFVPLFTGKPARFDATKFGWLGTPSIEYPLVLIWHAAPVKTIDDMKTKEITVGASGGDSTQSLYARLLNTTLGTKMKIVSGYRGQNDIFIAMERGEIDGYPSVFYSSLTSTRPTWLRDGLARVVVQYGPDKLADLPDVPWAPDLVANPDDRLLIQVATAPNALGRPLLMPPGVPADRLAAMRQALMETMADPQFKAEAEKIGLIVNAPRTGPQLEEAIVKAYAAPAEVLQRLRKLDQPDTP